MPLTFEEVEQDRQASERDLEYLRQIDANIRAFINNPCGEDRRFFRTDLMKWEAMLAECRRLHEKILKKHTELKPQ